MQAAAISQDIFQRNPKHPGRGAFHHPLVRRSRSRHPRACTAARAYSKIAPSAAHALHMPSHIFVQLGMWDDVVASNIVAYKAAVDLAEAQEPAARPRGLPHAVVAAVRVSAAGQVRRRAEVRRPGEGGGRQGHGAERPRWLRVDEGAAGRRDARSGRSWRCRPAPVKDGGAPGYDGSAAYVFAAGVSAAKLGDLATANVALEKLKAMRTQAESGSNAYRAKPFAIMEKEVAAVIAYAQKDIGGRRAAAQGSDGDRADARRAVGSGRADQAVVRALRRPAARR